MHMHDEHNSTLAFSIGEFCKRHSISRNGLYRLWATGKGPRVMVAGRRRLISVEAAAEWRRDRERAA